MLSFIIISEEIDRKRFGALRPLALTPPLASLPTEEIDRKRFGALRRDDYYVALVGTGFTEEIDRKRFGALRPILRTIAGYFALGKKK